MKNALIVLVALLACSCPSKPCSEKRCDLKLTNQSVPADKEARFEVVNLSSGHKVAYIRFGVEVTGESVDATILALRQAKAAGVDNIVIELNTPGGSVGDGFRLIKEIEALSIPTTCIADGEAASMGFVIIQACTYRGMTTRSRLMAHEPALGGMLYGNEHFYQEIVNILHSLNEAMMSFVAYKMCISVDDFREKTENKSYWMDSAEALKIGAVDFSVHSVRELLTPLAQEGELPAELRVPARERCP